MLIFAVRTQNGNIMGENEMQFPSEKLKEGMGMDEKNYPLDGRLLTKKRYDYLHHGAQRDEM